MRLFDSSQTYPTSACGIPGSTKRFRGMQAVSVVGTPCRYRVARECVGHRVREIDDSDIVVGYLTILDRSHTNKLGNGTHID